MTALENLDTESLERALRRARRAEDLPRVAALSLALSAEHRLGDRRGEAKEAYAVAFEACQEAGDIEGAEEAAVQISQMSLEEGEGREASRWSERALSLREVVAGSDERRARLLHNLAVAHIHLGEPARALERYREASRHWGDNPTDAYARRSSLIGQGELLVEAQEYTEAVGALLAGLALCREGVGPEEQRLEAAVGELLARALVGCGRQVEALEPLRRARRLWEHLEEPREHRRATLGLAEALLAISPDDPAWKGDEDPLKEGVGHCQAFMALSRASGDVDGMIYGGWLIARAFESRGRASEAAEAWLKLGEQVEQTGGSGRAYLRRAAQVVVEAESESEGARRAALQRAEGLYQAGQDKEGALWCLHQRLEGAVAAGDHAEAAEVTGRIRALEEARPEREIALLAHQAHHSAQAGQPAEAQDAAARALVLIGDNEHPIKTALQGILAAFG